MKVDIAIEEVPKSSVKMAQAWDKDLGLVTRLQVEFKTQPLREARILNLLRQGGPLSITISSSQALLDLYFADEAKGEVKMFTPTGSWRPREEFLVVRVEGHFDELSTGEPAHLAVVWREGLDSEHEVSAEFTAETATAAAIKAVKTLSLVPPNLEEPVDIIRTLAEAYTATPGLRELMLILEMGTFDITDQINAEAGGNDKKQTPKRRRKKKEAVTPDGEPVDEETGEIG